MRYYKIDITKKDGTPYQFKSLSGGGLNLPLTSLLPSGPQNPQFGVTNPAALRVTLDLAVANVSDPDHNQGALVQVWGLGLADLGSASDLNGLSIAVYAGMARGLPLANPAQAGLLVKGTIFQAYGNWIGVEQTLDLVLVQGGMPEDFPFSMPVGTTLSQAIINTLNVAMPSVPVSISISPNLVLNYDQPAHYQSFEQFAMFIKAFSQGIIGGTTYPGVQIYMNGDTIVVSDGTAPAKVPPVKNIAFQDLIGQPTWIGVSTISFKTVMRADIHQGDIVYLPQTLVTQQQSGMQNLSPSPQTKLTFSGNFQVQQIHHYGDSRQPDAASWNTTYQATMQAT